MSILKIEAFSGLSGDMFLGALAELTDGWDYIRQLPEKLGLKNVEVRITDVVKAGIACRHIKIVDHNTYHSFLKNDPHHGHGHHRHLSDIEKIIGKGDISGNAKDIAKTIFRLLGEAEAKVHGVDIQKIHFHEVGAIDSILDIVGTACLLDMLKITGTYAAPVCTGFGFVMTEHGRLPVPCPATKELLLRIPTYPGKAEGEMTTPTGAAILKYLQPEFQIPVLTEEKTGHGPGEKNFEHPNVLRITKCVESGKEHEEQIIMIETNIDDMSPELLGADFQNGLLEAGARDFFIQQITMKKGRQGVLLSVLSDQPNLDDVSGYIFNNSTTIGIRHYPVSRTILKREQITFKSSLGEVQVKKVILPDGRSRVTPEYESCREIAGKSGRSIMDVWAWIVRELSEV